MSDCFTEDMKPKLPREHYLDGYRDGVSESVKSWKPVYKNLKQRYQQLEQVAKGMQKCLAKHAFDWTQVAEETADYYREQLEALGVSLDG